MSRTIVVAIGGNSLIKDENHKTVEDQWVCVRETCSLIADMYNPDDKLVITHGNGPQVGFMLLRSDYCKDFLHTVPLDSCNADTQGAIGYQIQLSLANEFNKRNIRNKAVTTLVTLVAVAASDPGFSHPTKPIGSFYSKEEATALQKEHNWAIVEDANRGYRRVVASPKPLRIIELESIQKVLDLGNVVIACGGGGIPVVVEEDGSLSPKEAVVDKDFASSLLASELQADIFIISTAVPSVAIHFGTPDQQNLDSVDVDTLKNYIEAGHFAPGSMLPKVQAAIKYLENGGKKVIITNPANLGAAINGNAGTHIY